MKTHILYSSSIVFASLVIAGALVFARHSTTGPRDNGEQLRELRARIAHLESKSAALQKELDQVRRQTPSITYTPAKELIPPAVTSSAPQIPPGWKPFEFNGTTYYFTPLGQGTELSMAPTR